MGSRSLRVKEASSRARHRIVWLDDETEIITAWLDKWPVGAPWSVEVQPLDLDEDRLEALIVRPPTALVIDCAEGGFQRIYEILRSKVRCTILKSVVSAQTIEHHLQRHAELRDRTLQFPFEAVSLISLIEASIGPSVEESSSRAPSTTGEPVSAATPDGLLEGFLPAHVTARTFDGRLEPIAKSSAWKSLINRPEQHFNAEARQALEAGHSHTELFFGTDPADDATFALLQSTLVPLSNTGAHRVLQLVQPLSPQLMDAERGGLALYGSSVEGVIALMRQANFARGRYYRIAVIDGLIRPALELVACEPVNPDQPALPATAEMDDQELVEFQDYVNTRRTSEELHWVKEPVTPDSFSLNDNRIWHLYVPDAGITERLVVPVFMDEEAMLASSTQAFEEVLHGVFVFDMGKPGSLDDRLVKGTATSLRHAIQYLGTALRAERTGLEQRLAETLLRMQRELAVPQPQAMLERVLTNFALYTAFPERDATRADRQDTSAMFARYDGLHQRLTVTAETDPRFEGLHFDMRLNRFVVVRAAIAALDAIKERRAPQALFVPDLWQLRAEKPDWSIRREDWDHVEGCSGAIQDECHSWLDEKVRSVVAYALVASDQLLGVLVVRGSLPYSFNRFRVDSLRACAESAMPFLARAVAEDHRQNFDGLVMHEMRSLLTRVRDGLQAVGQARSEADRADGLKDAERITGTGYALTQLFLSYLKPDGQEDRGGATDDQFWRETRTYGELCAKAPAARLMWRDEVDGTLRLKDKAVLERVLRVLIDNAFRYGKADRSPAQVLFAAARQDDGQTALLTLTNPGVFNGRLDDADLSTVAKPMVGLYLSRYAALASGAQLTIDNEQGAVCARLKWPLTQEGSI